MLTGLVMQSPVAAQFWAGLEVIGPPGTMSSMREAIGFAAEGPVTDLSSARDACERAKRVGSQLLPPAIVSCEIVGLPGGATYLVVNASHTPSVATRLEGGALSAHLVEIANRFEARRSAQVSAGSLGAEQIDSEGRQQFLSADLRELQDRHLKEVESATPRLLECAASCAEPRDRAISIVLLEWVRMEGAIRDVVAHCLNDPAPQVRNNASRYLRRRLSLLMQSPGGVHELTKAAIQQVQQPTHMDRNKGLFMLEELLSLNLRETACSVLQIQEHLALLANNSVLPNVGPIASTVSKQAALLAGTCEKEDLP